VFLDVVEKLQIKAGDAAPTTIALSVY